MFGLNLLILRCGDLNRSEQFYRCLGLSFDRHRHGQGPEHLAVEGSAGVIELYPSNAAAVETTGLGFGVDDLPATVARLIESGFSPGEIKDRQWGRTSIVRDPDGRRVELKQT